VGNRPRERILTARDTLSIVLFNTDAIVIRRGPYSETSQVADLLTAGEGRITTLVLGAYRTKSAFGGPLDLLTRGEAVVRRRRTTELDVLQAFPLTHPYRGLRASVLQWSAACHALELVRAFAWPRDQESQLFRLLTGFLDAIDGNGMATESAVLDAWLLTLPGRLLASAGLQPMLDACVGCGSAVRDAASSDIRWDLSFDRGGVLCRTCADGSARSTPITPGVRSLLQRAVLTAPAAVATPLDRDVGEARRLLELYLEYRLDRQLYSRRFLERCLVAAGGDGVR